MKERLPVVLENRELPSSEKKENSGYASVLFILSLIVMAWSALTIVLLSR